MNLILFPFDRVIKGASIAIYGAGEIGEYFLRQLAAVPFCHVVWLVDKKFKSLGKQQQLICLPPALMDWQQPDQIIIASQLFEEEITKYLVSEGVDPTRIVGISAEQKIDVLDLIQTRLNATPADDEWDAYYKLAENSAQAQYNRFIQPVLSRLEGVLDYSNVLDFACGKGRIAEIVHTRCQYLQLVDASFDAIEFCRQRFAKYSNISMQCNGTDQLPQQASSLSLIYSWDAMVHFSYKSLDFYLGEFNRVLKDQEYVVMHHSNLGALVDKMRVFDQWNLNPAGRSRISKDDVALIAQHHNFEVVEQTLIDWECKDMDCISVLRKAAGVRS